MKLGEIVVSVVITLAMCAFIGWQSGKIDRLNNQLLAHESINKVTQSAINLHYQVSLDNIKAKQLEDSEHGKVKAVIKTALKDNECANTAVPDDVVNQLQQQERNIRSRSANTYSSTLNK
ncbi:hypothetical protein [Providencia rettgeri]|uniref:hypothetical protein n=1 Tax=Providencia rettgeri TaxID=587 RepID=UPI00384E99DC